MDIQERPIQPFPSSTFDRRLFYLWLLATLGAAFAFLVPGVVTLLMFVGIGIPLLMLPMWWPYWGMPVAVYLIIRALDHRLMPAIIASFTTAAVIVLAGYQIAAIGIDRTKLAAADLKRDDNFQTLKIDPVETIVELKWTVDEDKPSSLRCFDTCQRMLFSGFAKRYAIGRPAQLNPETLEQGVLVIHELVPIQDGCDESMLFVARAEERDFRGVEPRNNLMLADALVDLEFDEGLCFKSTRLETVEADIVWVEDWDESFLSTQADPFEPRKREYYDWRLTRIDTVQRYEMFFRREGGLERLIRKTRFDYELLDQPLSVELPIMFSTFNSGGWKASKQYMEIEFLSLDKVIERDFSVGN